MDEIPGMWKPNLGDEWSMRFWAIDEDGRVKRVPKVDLRGVGNRAGKDAEVIAASLYCRFFRPHAIIMASEIFGLAFQSATGDADYRRMMRVEGDLLSLMDPENRVRLVKQYNATLMEGWLSTARSSANPPSHELRYYDILTGKPIRDHVSSYAQGASRLPAFSPVIGFPKI